MLKLYRDPVTGIIYQFEPGGQPEDFVEVDSPAVSVVEKQAPVPSDKARGAKTK